MAGEQGFDISKLFENKLAMQYLSGAGAAIAGEGSVAADVDKMTQQNISAQSQAATQNKYIKMMTALLKPGVEFKSDVSGKATVSGNMETLSSILGGGEEFDPLSRSSEGGGTAASSTPKPITPLPEDKYTVNPSSSPLGEITASDLAGLTSADVSRALTGATGVAALKERTIANVRDSQIADQRNAIAYYNAISKDERTMAQKNYAMAQGQGYKDSFVDFLNLNQTGNYDDYLKAVEGGYRSADGGEPKFHEWLLEVKKAGSTQVILPGDRAREAAIGRQEADVVGPDFPLKVIDDLKKDRMKWSSDEATQKAMKEYGISYGEAQKRIQWRMTAEEMNRQILLKYPKAKYVPGKGWYVGEKLIQNTPAR